MDSLLDGLDSAAVEVDDYTDSIDSILALADLESLKEGVHLLHLLG